MTLNEIAHEAAARITPETWIQGEMDDETGRHCAHGWVMACAPQVGDGLLVRVAMRHHGFGEQWNDADGRSADQVSAALAALDVDAALRARWGAPAGSIVALTRRVASLTPEEEGALFDAWDSVADSETYDIAQSAALDLLSFELASATSTVWDACEDLEDGSSTQEVIQNIARAVTVRNRLTPEHYQTLTEPWAKVIGPAHPDDKPVRSADIGEERRHVEIVPLSEPVPATTPAPAQTPAREPQPA